MRSNRSVLDLLNRDEWTLVKGDTDERYYLFRFRTPLPEPEMTGDFLHLLRCIWEYAPESSGEMPSPEVTEDLQLFENRLCEAWELGSVAVLAAVLTFDGVRQWIFYTCNAKECVRLLNEMPQNKESYPIQLDTREDPNWSYVREQIIAW